jgi:hypothetical protein
MSKNINIGSALLKFTFTDEDGEVFSSFRLNPADIKLGQRCQELSAHFSGLSERIPQTATVEDAVKFNDELEDKICYLLGYDAKQSLFGQISATSIMADGNMFAVHVMNQIIDAVGPEIEKRKNAMKKAAQYTAKYQ